MAIPLKEVSEDLVCCICLSVPLDPTMSPCHHIFCLECIPTAFAKDVCPIDQKPCVPEEVTKLEPGSFPYRQWSSVEVKCEAFENGCAWKGSVSDYKDHRIACESKFQSLKSRCNSLEHDLKTATENYQTLKAENGQLLRQLNDAKKEIRRLRGEKQSSGTSLTPFTPTTKQDGTGIIAMNSISAIPNYEDKSAEELRVEDYIRGNKGNVKLQPFTGFGFGGKSFGSSSGTSVGFGSTPAPATSFGSSSASRDFSSTTPFSSVKQQPVSFGSSSLSIPSPPGTSAFGDPAPAQSSKGGFSFGAVAPAPPTFSFGFSDPAPPAQQEIKGFSFSSPAPAPTFGLQPFGSSAYSSSGFGPTTAFGSPASSGNSL